MSKHPQPGLSFPVTPQHSQMRVVKFMRQEPECLLRTKICEIQPVRRRGVSAYEQGQKVLGDLNHQIAQPLFVCGGETRIEISQPTTQLLAAETQMSTVVSQTSARSVWEHH